MDPKSVKSSSYQSREVEEKEMNLPEEYQPKGGKVISGEATFVKPSIGRRLYKMAKKAAKQAIKETLIPKACDTASGFLKDFIDSLFYDEDTRPRKKHNYNNYTGSGSSSSAPKKPEPQTYYGRPNYDDVIVDTKREAIDVRDRLIEYLEKYGVVTVRDFYDAVRDATDDEVNYKTDYPDYNVGWTDLSEMEIIQVRNGWRIEMPAPVRLRR